MKLRRLTEEGIEAFSAYLAQAKADPKLAPPTHLLDNPAMSEAVAEVEVEERCFATRFEVAEYLVRTFEAAGIQNPEGDPGLWSWLTLRWFEHLRPARGKMGWESARYIPTRYFAKSYRHLLLGPYIIFRAHIDDPERAMALLLNPPNQPGEIVGQFAANRDLVTNRAVMGAVTRLYVDMRSRKFRKGARGSSPGSPRRLTAVMNHFDLTYDLPAMNDIALIHMLPKEFDKFRKQTEVAEPASAP